MVGKMSEENFKYQVIKIDLSQKHDNQEYELYFKTNVIKILQASNPFTIKFNSITNDAIPIPQLSNGNIITFENLNITKIYISNPASSGSAYIYCQPIESKWWWYGRI